MRILFFGNNWVAWRVISWLKGSGEDIVGLIIHPEGRRKYGQEIIAASGLEQDRIFDGSRLQDEATLSAIQSLQPEIGLSVFFGYILKPGFLGFLPKGCLNLHPALLPYNRGSYPNVWSIIEGTPAGVTLHYMDERVDTGDIVVQREVPVDLTDTGETLYRKLEVTCVELFQQSWATFKNGALPRRPQPLDAGSSHRIRDIESLDEIDLERSYKARDLINLLRARTFSSYPGAYFRDKERKVYLRLQLTDESTLKEERDRGQDH
jgi:methionyl-tRNA formyltransferase